MTFQNEALAYAAHGLAVFPLQAHGKIPYPKTHGVLDASRDPEQIQAWWAEHPDANIGIATGSPSGVVVFDIDGDAGDESLKALAERGLELPMTPTVSTGKGVHLYFRHPGGSMGNRAGMAPGLDLRGDGGYVVAPPSIHPSGRQYEWAVGLEVPFAVLPEILKALAVATVAAETVTTGPVPPGRRNDTAFRDASTMRRRGMPEAAILSALLADDRYNWSEFERAHEVPRIAKNAAKFAPDAAALADEAFKDRMKAKANKRIIEHEDPEDEEYVPGIEMSDVQPERTAWLWHPYFPAGKLVIVDGDPGLGKSTLLLDLAARWSRGDANPDGTVPDQMPDDGMGAVVISVEDGLADTVQPRLVAQRANLANIRAIVEIQRKGVDLAVTIPNDIQLIERAINLKRARFVIIDPIMAVLSPDVDSHKDQEIRAKALQPLKELAERTGCTIALVRHFNKVAGGSAVYRGGGSIGIVGAMRSAMIVAKDPSDPHGDGRVFAHAKSNLARSGPSYSYTIEEGDGVGRFVWGDTIDLTADQLVNQDLRDAPKKAEAAQFLKDALANGPVAVKDLKQMAENEGLSWRTVDAAAYMAGVLKVKESKFGGPAAVWKLKGHEDDGKTRE